MKTLIKIAVIVLVLLSAGLSSTVMAEDRGVTVSCNGYSCVATSKYDGKTISYNKNGSHIGPFPKAGEVRLYITTNGVKVTLSYNGNSKAFYPNGSQSAIDTGIMVSQGGYVSVDVYDIGYGSEIGWHTPHSGNMCGSGFVIPPTGTGYYPIIDVSSEISWASQAGELLVSKQCWADWPEWEGDYDFEDYFMALSYVPQSAVQPTVDLKVNGSDGTIYLQEPADYTLSWTSTNAQTCSASNAWSGSKSINGSEFVNDKSQGTYTYTITCWNGSQSATDTVQAVVRQDQVYPTVDLKINGSDSTAYLTAPANYTLSWTSNNAQYCNASNAWSGTKSLSGSEGYSNIINGTYTYTITCWNGSQSATDTVQAVVSGGYAYLSVSKLARNVTQGTQFVDSVDANQSEIIEFSLDVYSNGSGMVSGSYVRDILPSYLDFMEGSVKIDGYPASDSLVSSGLYLGNLSSLLHKRVTFTAYVMSGLPVGTNVLTNSSRAWANGVSEVADTALVVVTVQGTNPTASIWVQKTVRDTVDPNTPSGVYLEDVNTIPGRELEFSITVTGTGGTTSNDVMVHDTLPTGLTYVPGSTTVNGSVVADGIVTGGINLGAISPGQAKTVKFRATVRENAYFTVFVTKLINSAVSKGSNNSVEMTDTANVWVSKSGRVLGATDIDTGVDMNMLSALLASGFGAFGLSGFQVGKKAYWRGKIAQLRKAA